METRWAQRKRWVTKGPSALEKRSSSAGAKTPASHNGSPSYRIHIFSIPPSIISYPTIRWRGMEESSGNHHAKSPVEEGDEGPTLIRAAHLMTCSSALSMVLKTAIELDVLEIIARAGPSAQISAAEIVAHIPTTNPGAPETLDRILRFLASNSVLTCSIVPGDEGGVQRRYGLTPACRFLTKNEDGLSMGALALMNQDKVLLDSWQLLKYAVLEGVIPFAKAHGMTAFEYPGSDPRFNQVFNQGMSGHSIIMTKKILDVYKRFQDINVLVDVGGGIGTTLHMIVSKYPHIKGINFDLPHVISDAPSLPGVEHVRGDMFVSIPTGDAIFMKSILHDWSDEHCVKILQKCWKALPDSGKVIAVEGILPEAPETNQVARLVFYSDLCMLTYNVGGKERSEKEFESLAKQAGFSGIKLICCVLAAWVIEFYK